MKTSRSLGLTMFNPYKIWVVSVDWTQRSMSGWIDPSLATDICRQHSPFVAKCIKIFHGTTRTTHRARSRSAAFAVSDPFLQMQYEYQAGTSQASSPRENTAPLYGWHPLHQPPWFLGWIIWRGHGIFDIFHGLSHPKFHWKSHFLLVKSQLVC